MAEVNTFRFAIAAVDAVLFAVYEGKLVTLIRPVETETGHYQGMYGFPGGVMLPTENAEETLMRQLKEKAGLGKVYHEQLYTFTDVARDARSRAIAIAYLGCVTPDVVAAYTHEKAVWKAIKEIDALAYDHLEILRTAHKRLASRLLYTTIARTLLPKKFTLSELQSVYEVVRGEALDKRNFRKKILALDIIEDSGEVQSGVANRPATLYQFVGKDVVEMSPVM